MRTRKVTLNLPLLTDAGYEDIGVEFTQVKADIQDATHWLCLAHTVILNNSLYKDHMGEDFYPEDLMQALREFDESLIRMKKAVVDFRKEEKIFSKNKRDEEDGVLRARKALEKMNRDYNRIK